MSANHVQTFPPFFLNRAQYDQLIDRDEKLIERLIEESPNRLWSIGGCYYYGATRALIEEVAAALK